MHTVVAGDTLWDLARAYLGSGDRWHEIYALNRGRPQPGGGTLTDPARIYPGWDLLIPAAARTPGTAAGTRPAPATRPGTAARRHRPPAAHPARPAARTRRAAPRPPGGPAHARTRARPGYGCRPGR